MKLWRIELDQEEACWLSRLVESAETAINKNRLLKLDSGDMTNVQDIIRQIGHVDPPRKSIFYSEVVGIKKKIDYGNDKDCSSRDNS
jgi:hypothetical protein